MVNARKNHPGVKFAAESFCRFGGGFAGFWKFAVGCLTGIVICGVSAAEKRKSRVSPVFYLRVRYENSEVRADRRVV